MRAWSEKDKAFEWIERDFQAKAALAEINWSIPFESYATTRVSRIFVDG